MTVLYLHGIGSGADSRTPRVLREVFPAYTVLAPELPVSPKQAVAFIREYVSANRPDLIVGTSLGGFYALTVPDVCKVIVNPALFADEDIRDGVGMGTHPFFCKRSDGATDYAVDVRMLDELCAIREETERLRGEERKNVWALFGKNDTLLHRYDDFCRLYGADRAFLCAAEHRLTESEIKNELAEVIRKTMCWN